jgi:hypothetical protein
MHAALTDEQIDEVVAAVRSYCGVGAGAALP